MPQEIHGNIHVSDTPHGRYIDIQIPGKSIHTTLFQESETKKWFVVSQEFAQRAGLILDVPVVHSIGFLAMENQGSIQKKRIVFLTSDAIRDSIEELLSNTFVGDESELVQLNPRIGINTLTDSGEGIPARIQQELSIPQ